MTEPKLTIAIPHLDRSELLQHAIDSCLRQTTPVKIIVADQGQTRKTKLLMDRYKGHPHVSHVPSPATSLWENWKFSIEQADTPYAAFLQDDDEIFAIYASRVVEALDRFPDALHWQARCNCSNDRQHFYWWGANGPVIGLRTDLGIEQWPGGYLLASMYLTSWALSPGVAFRRGPELTAALEGMPPHCDLFAERLILAAMGAQGSWVADPVLAGLWMHHGENESYKQNNDGSVLDQRKVMAEHLDDLLDRFGDWQSHFMGWLKYHRSPVEVLGYLKDFPTPESRHTEEIKDVMGESLRGRVKIVEVPVEPDPIEGCVIYEDVAA